MAPHERLDQLMKARRVELRMSWRDVASAAHMSEAALRAIRRGKYNPSDVTRRSLDDALRWTDGSVDAVLDGGDPTPVESAPRGDEDDDYVPTDDQVDDLLQYMLRARATAPTPATVQKANDIIELLRASKSDRTRRGLVAFLHTLDDYADE